jgi:hypothetical protein
MMTCVYGVCLQMLGLGSSFLGLDSTPSLAAGTSWLASIILLRLFQDQHIALACAAALSLSALSVPASFTDAWVEDAVETGQGMEPPVADDGGAAEDISDLLGVAAGPSGSPGPLDRAGSAPVHW